MKHVFIINPIAGGGDSEKVYLPQILKAVKEQNVEYEIHRSLTAADVANWVRTRAKQGDSVRFYACGGDGTINNVASGMVGFDNADLAIIPCGTGNDFVKNFTNVNNSLDLKKLMNGKSEAVDVIAYGDRISVNMLNIGIDCDVVVEVDKFKDKIKGPMAYIAGAAKVLGHGKKYRMKYCFKGEEFIEEDFMLVAIGNGKYCGGGFKSCPKANLQDGLMDVCIVRPVGSKLIPMLLKYKSGTHVDSEMARDYIRYVQCESFHLTASEPVNVSNDGEVASFEDAEFTVKKKALRVVIPEGSELIP